MLSELLNKKFLTRSLIGLALLYFIIGLNFDLNIYDEGIGLLGAERLASGELPYRDFWTIYPPLNYYIIAGFSFLFGGSVMSARFLSLFIAILNVFFLHKLIKWANEERPKFVAGLAIIVTSGMSLFFARAMAPALLFSTLSMLFLIKSYTHTEGKNYRLNLFFSGFFCGLTLLARLDTGFLLFISIIISVFLFKYLNPDAPAISSKFSTFRTILIFKAGVLTPVIPILIYFLMNVDYNLIIDQLITVPLMVYTSYRKIPRLHLWDILHATGMRNAIYIFWFGIYSLLPGAAALLIFFKVGLDYKKKKSLNPRTIITMPLIIFGFLLVVQTIVRPDNEHFLPAWIFTIAALFAYFDKSVLEKKYQYTFNIIIFGFVSFILAMKFDIPLKSHTTTYSGIKKIPRAERILISDEWKKDLEPTVNYIKTNSKRTDRIFVANDIHDMGYRNDAMLYFLSERLPASRYHELHPGVVSTIPVQNEIINKLYTGKVKYIVRVHSINNFKESNLSSKSSGVHLLDNYINNNYLTIQRFGIYEILELKHLNLLNPNSKLFHKLLINLSINSR